MVPDLGVVGEGKAERKGRSDRIRLAKRDGKGEVAVEEVYAVELAQRVGGVGGEATLLGGELLRGRGQRPQQEERKAEEEGGLVMGISGSAGLE